MNNNADFQLIIVGAGAITQAAHLPAALASPLVNVVAIVDTDLVRARRICAVYGADIPVSPSIDAVSTSFDGAIVATPNHLHAPMTKTLLERGVPVLVEKPMAVEESEAEEIVAIAAARGLIVSVGYHTRHSGACRVLKHCVASGRFGETLRIAHQDGSIGGWSPVSAYNLNMKTAGGGVLTSTGTHFIDRLIWFWGMPDQIQYSDDSRGGPESHCILRFSYRRKQRALEGLAIFSKVMGLAENTIIETEEGLLIMQRDSAEDILFRPRSDVRLSYRIVLQGIAPDRRSLYQRQLEDFVNACRGGEQPCVNAETGLQSVRLLNKLYATRQALIQPESASTAEVT